MLKIMDAIAWQQYLNTIPDGDPTEWLGDILAAFKKQKIDFIDARLSLQKYIALENEYMQDAIFANGLLDKEDKIQDMQRARAYNELRK